MALDLATFRSEFPLLAGRTDEQIQSALDRAALIHSIREAATLYCAAHLLVVDSESAVVPDGGSGVISSEGIGPQQRTYKTLSGEDERRVFFETTAFGRQFLVLENRSPRASIGARIVS